MARVFVITGPSGVGKGTLIRTLRERLPDLELSVSATTRAPRPGERDGVDYHFLDDADFQRRVDSGEFVEHATYSGRRYGTLLEDRFFSNRAYVLIDRNGVVRWTYAEVTPSTRRENAELLEQLRALQ